MRKGVIVGLIIAIFMLTGSVVYAKWPGGHGKCFSRYAENDLEKIKQFQHDTLQLRDDLIAKKIAIRQEYSRDLPDRQKIASLQKEVIDIRTQIHQKADETGIHLRGYGRINKREMCRNVMMRGHHCPTTL